MRVATRELQVLFRAAGDVQGARGVRCRANQVDGAGRKGPAYATKGCIRTTDAAMAVIESTHDSAPLQSLTVE